MKKIMLILPFVLAGCMTQVFYPYTGIVKVTGEGGFLLDVIPEEDVSSGGLFSEKPKYRHDEVAFFLSGLPENKKCYLLGIMQHGGDRWQMAKFILERGGNVATQSGVSMPLKLDDNKGVFTNGLAGSTTVSTVYTKEFGSITSIEHVFNVFDCDD